MPQRPAGLRPDHTARPLRQRAAPGRVGTEQDAPGLDPAAAAETANVAGRAAGLGSQAGRPGLGSVWFAQMASYDALAVASAVGRAVPRTSVGTAVVPIYPRHPQILASVAKTAQAATGGRFQLKSTTPATPRPPSVDTRPREGRPGTGDDGLASVAETLAGLTAAARSGGLDDTAALSALAAARGLAAELERSELALIEAARDGEPRVTLA